MAEGQEGIRNAKRQKEAAQEAEDKRALTAADIKAEVERRKQQRDQGES